MLPAQHAHNTCRYGCSGLVVWNVLRADRLRIRFGYMQAYHNGSGSFVSSETTRGQSSTSVIALQRTVSLREFFHFHPVLICTKQPNIISPVQLVPAEHRDVAKK
ncbi:unnamed protein product [Ectocarpus sp. 12 AP-2014]